MKKIQQGFTLIELMVTVTIVGVLASISIPMYQNYIIDVKWAKTVTGIRALQLAIETCLIDNNVSFSRCDEMSDNKIKRYGVTEFSSANDEFYSISLIKDDAAIKINGKTPLADCILTIQPNFNDGQGSISWRYAMESGSALANAEVCSAYVKGSTWN